MNKLLIGGAVALVIAVAPAIAQTAPPPGVAPGTAPTSVTPGSPGAPRMHMMVTSDREMTREDVAKHVRRLFAKLDTNRDGFITRQEVDAVHGTMMGKHATFDRRVGGPDVMFDNRGAMFDELDANHDGSISRQEFMASKPQQERRVMIFRHGSDGAPGTPGEPGMKMRMHSMGMGFGGHLFEMADANRDGRVSLQEAETAALQHFDRADTNHDGKITPDERGQAHKIMRMERRPS
jgi:Ca2+-binding EF-hand superfamily protein